MSELAWSKSRNLSFHFIYFRLFFHFRFHFSFSKLLTVLFSFETFLRQVKSLKRVILKFCQIVKAINPNIWPNWPSKYFKISLKPQIKKQKWFENLKKFKISRTTISKKAWPCLISFIKRPNLSMVSVECPLRTKWPLSF